MSIKKTTFKAGQIVEHSEHGYRAVITSITEEEIILCMYYSPNLKQELEPSLSSIPIGLSRWKTWVDDNFKVVQNGV